MRPPGVGEQWDVRPDALAHMGCCWTLVWCVVVSEIWLRRWPLSRVPWPTLMPAALEAKSAK